MSTQYEGKSIRKYMWDDVWDVDIIYGWNMGCGKRMGNHWWNSGTILWEAHKKPKEDSKCSSRMGSGTESKRGKMLWSIVK